MMDGQSPNPEAALLNSSLNKLPPEVRRILYSYLLTQPYEILISYKRFRTRFDKQGLFPENCMYCSRPQASCKCNNLKLNDEFYYQQQQLPRLSISTAILSTCRIVYNEATPLLYKQNSYVSIALSYPPLFRTRDLRFGRYFPLQIQHSNVQVTASVTTVRIAEILMPRTLDSISRIPPASNASKTLQTQITITRSRASFSPSIQPAMKSATAGKTSSAEQSPWPPPNISLD